MSYKHLAGRLIETQRSMLGEPAIDVARSTEGIVVDASGTVTAVEGDGRAVVDDLAHRYTDMLGSAAETRLRAAAREFEDELALPPSLGGRADVTPAHRDPAAHDPLGDGPAAYEPDGKAGVDETADTDGDRTTDEGRPDRGRGGDRSPDEAGTTRPPTAGAHETDPATGAVSDGGAVESRSSDDGTARVRSPTPSGPGEVVSPTPAGPGDVTSSTSAGSGEVVSPTPGARERTDGDSRTGRDGRVVDSPSVSTTTETDGTPDDSDRSTGGGESDAATDEEPTSYERAADDAKVTLEDPVTVRYTVASDLATIADATADPSSVYLLPDGTDGWQAPVTVAEAVTNALSDATDRDPETLGAATDSVEVDRLLATLRGEAGETVSFELDGTLQGLTVTFHHTGALAVH